MKLEEFKKLAPKIKQNFKSLQCRICGEVVPPSELIRRNECVRCEDLMEDARRDALEDKQEKLYRPE